MSELALAVLKIVGVVTELAVDAYVWLTGSDRDRDADESERPDDSDAEH